jgi:putative peptidoglycan lipid II flippase
MNVANVLKIYAIALPFFILSRIVKTIFYAIKDTKTPMINSIQCLVINIFFALILCKFIGVTGIAIATTISTIYTTFSLLYKILKKKIFIFADIFITKLLKILYCSLIMFIVIVSVNSFLSDHNFNIFFNFLLSGGLGGIIYLILSYFLDILNLEFLKIKFHK